MPPEGVVEQGLKAIKQYLNDVKDTRDTDISTKSLELLKVVLVGSSGAGKTRYHILCWAVRKMYVGIKALKLPSS